MKVSIVIPVLDSHEIVRRQLLYFKNMNLPDDVEIIFVDDGSDPPLKTVSGADAITIYETNDTAEWTQPSAKNYGVKQATGEFIIVTDIDHIIPRDIIELARAAEVDLIRFKREAGILDENGDFTAEWEVLKTWGMLPRNGKRISPHSNSFAIRRGLYLELGGVSERYCGTGKYPNREEIPFKKKLWPLLQSGEVEYIGDDNRPTIFMMPNGRYCGDRDFNPFGFFHNTTRKGKRDLHKTNRHLRR